MAKPKAKKRASSEAKGGRPTKYNPEILPVVTNYCLLGADDQRLAEFLGISLATLHNWKKAHPQFLDALKAGKDQADAEVAQSLFHRAKGYSHKSEKIVADAKTGASVKVPYIEHYPPDTTACIFWLKNRQRETWRDEQKHDHTHKGDVTVNHIRDGISRKLARIASAQEAGGLASQPVAGRA